MNLQPINASASPEVQTNENFETLDFASVYGKDPRTTQNLTWVYYGGRWAGFTITGGLANAITLTNTADNYLVVLKSTGVLSSSTATTNWNNTTLYARVYKVTTAGGVVTAIEDNRGGSFGVFALTGGLGDVVGPASATDGLPAVWDGTTGKLLKSLTAVAIRAALGIPSLNQICNGRLTLTSGLSVTVADVLAAETIYWTPHGGNSIALYDGTNWVLRTFAELSVDVPDVTNSHDVFAYDNAGTVALEVLAWTSVNVRATALVLQDGVLVKSGATTRRYLGSFYCTTAGNGQTEDSFAKRWLYNYYNRYPRPFAKYENSAGWSYATATVRAMNNNPANSISVITGVQDQIISVRNRGLIALTTGSAYVGIGFDSSTSQDAAISLVTELAGRISGDAIYSSIPTIGMHTYYAVEVGSTGGSTFYGTYGAIPSHGIFGSFDA